MNMHQETRQENRFLRKTDSKNLTFSSSNAGSESPTCVWVDQNAARWDPWGFQRQHIVVCCVCGRWRLRGDALDHLRVPGASGVSSRVDQWGAGDAGPGRGWNRKRQLGAGERAGRGADATAWFWTWGDKWRHLSSPSYNPDLRYQWRGDALTCCFQLVGDYRGWRELMVIMKLRCF